jgi:hypothetical protein
LTGEVFIATAKGMISFNRAKNCYEDLTNVYVYPNPVRPQYDGKSTGLINRANVKITDIAGNLVKAISEGGTMEWDTCFW